VSLYLFNTTAAHKCGHINCNGAFQALFFPGSCTD